MEMKTGKGLTFFIIRLEDGDAGVIARGLDCEGKEITVLYAGSNRRAEPPDEKTW